MLFKEQGRVDQKRLGRLIVGSLGLLLAIGYTIQAIGMPQGTAASPGPGLFPIGVGLAGTAISLVVVLEAFFTAQTTGTLDLPKGTQRKKVLLFMGSLLALILLLPVLGQYVAATLYVIVFLKIMSPLNWPRSIICGAVTGIAVSWIFIELLAIRLPTGIW